jgi:hypothetical protein
MKSHRLFKASPHPVPLDRVAVLLGDGEADAGFAFRFFPVENLEQEEAASAFLAVANGKKLRAAFQPPGSIFGLVRRQFARHLNRAIPA